MKFTDENGNLMTGAYDFLFGIYQRIGGVLSALNAATLLDKTWGAPAAIGNNTPNSGAFTSLSATSLTTGSVKVGNTKTGLATLVAGTVTVNTSNVTSNSSIFVTSNIDGGTPGFLRAIISPGSSFTIKSSSTTDTSTVAWLMIERG
jgi:hypothetical protein